MSFDTKDILEDFAEATGGRREFFDGESYSFRRLGKLDNGDLAKLLVRLKQKRFRSQRPEYHAAWMRAWRAANAALARARDAAKYRAQMADPQKREARRLRWQKWNASRSTDPVRAARARELARKYYHQRKARQALEAPP